MTPYEVTRTITVTNPEGFHLRAATLFVACARQFGCDVRLGKGDQRVDGKSTPLQLMVLGAGQGDTLLLEAAGEDAEAAMEALVDLFTSNFQEECDPEGEPSRLGEGAGGDECSAG